MVPGKKDEEEIFHAAIEKPQEQRLAYLKVACEGDVELLDHLEALLQVYDSPDDFLGFPTLAQNVTLDESSLTEAPGTIIGRYKLLEKIGEGGMAVVYMAEQEQPIHRKVALKIIKLGMDTKRVITRFEAERQALALMDHPHIAKVLDAGAADSGRPFFVMELVTGVSIIDYCDTNRLNTQERLELFVQVCNAIQHAHQKGIIHRDIKPSNVMVTLHDGKPVPKVIDFGIAKATNRRLTEKTLFTRFAQMIGTPAYMSPEQVEMSSFDVDTRSDIYSLGILLYELLTGVTPFCAKELRQAGYLEMQRMIREEEPAVPSTRLTTLGETLTTIAQRRKAHPDVLKKRIRGDLDWIVMKSLEKDRTRRYETASEFITDIERHLNNEPVLAGPPSGVYRMKKFMRRHRASVTLAVAIMVGFIISTVMYFRAEQARAEEAATRTEAQAVTDFLMNDLLASVHPEKAKSQEVTVRYILEAASGNLERKFENRPLVEAKIRQTLGLTYQKMGDHEAAEQHLQRSLQIRRTQLGEDNPSTLATINDLGLLRCYQGRYHDSELLLVKAFEGRRRILGDEHPDTVESLANLGFQYMMQARFNDGMTLSQQAFEIASRVLGEEHPVTLQSRASVTLGYITTNQTAKAESLSTEGMEISRRVFGDEHETTLDLTNLLVWVHSQRRRYDRGMELAISALEIGRRVLGENHPATMFAMSNLGHLYCQQGLYDEAALLLNKSVEHSKHVLGEFHGYRSLFILRLARLYRRRGQHRQEETLLIKAFQISRQTHGNDHPQTGYIKYHLNTLVEQLGLAGTEQYRTGDYQEAHETVTRSEEIHRLIYGKSNPTYMGFMAMSLYQLGREQEGREVLNRLRIMYEQDTSVPEENPLYRAEQLFTQGDSQALAMWKLVEAGELEKATLVVAELLAQSDSNGIAVTASLQSLARALARAYCLRGNGAEIDKQYHNAKRYYQAAIHVLDDYALPLYRLAWLLATCPDDEVRDSDKAIEFATKACALTQWKKAEYIDALAAAHAEAGQFTVAIEWQQKAIDSLPQEMHRGVRAGLVQRLRRYESGKPLHMQHKGSIVAWWKLDEATDGRVIDASGNGHHGRLVGGAKILTDVERGGVLSLTGHGYVDCGTDAAFDIMGPMTVMVWIKVDAFSTGHRTLVSAGGSNWGLERIGGTSNRGNRGFVRWEHEIPNDSPTVLRGARDMIADTWHHIAGVHDGMKMSLYFDGELDISRGVAAAMDISSKPVCIGAGPVAPERAWNGLIDDVRIYNYGLSEAEIRTVYQESEYSSLRP
ncbi:tetratricopeptide repeat protein [Planctomycetota bacterium]